LLGKIIDIAKRERDRDIPLDADFFTKLDALEIRLEALSATALRLLSAFDSGGVVGAEPSMLKLKGSQLVQDMDRCLFDAIGYYGIPVDSVMRNADPIGEDYEDMIASGLFHHRGYTIAGGSSEIQHNIIAKAVLGL